MSRPARAYRLGMLVSAIEQARAIAGSAATRCIDLLPDDDRKRLTEAVELLHGIEQRLWARTEERK